ncbi:MAG: hypothetical protein JST85_18475 [Acidobacteria bacterium]|nr:hypothetical protein [Acidobacteriota bacterium]
MNEKQSELREQAEQQVTLSELEEGVRLPDEKPRRNRRRKILLALLALVLLAVVTVGGAYYLLRGERVDLKANKRLPDKVASGKDIKQAAYDSISGSLSGPVKTSSQEPTPTASATDSTEKISAPVQAGIATTLAPPPEALLTGTSAPEYTGQRNQEQPLKSAPSASNQSAKVSMTRPSATQSVRFAGVAQIAGGVKGSAENITRPASPITNSVASKDNPSDQNNSLPHLVKRTSSPNFGAMLPVRLVGVLYTLRQGSLARLELVRDLKGGSWQLRRGTVFVGQTLGGDLDRAYLQIKGFIDPNTQTFTKLEGEVLGNDGGAGLRGKRRRISPAWVRVLDRTAEAGVQIATGVLNRRSSSVVIAADPYGTYRSASGADGSRSDQNRTFVEVQAGTSGFVMVTTLPEPSSDSHLAKAGQREESLTDEELARLMAEADPARIRAALPRMNPELQRVAQMVLKEIEAEKP